MRAKIAVTLLILTLSLPALGSGVGVAELRIGLQHHDDAAEILIMYPAEGTGRKMLGGNPVFFGTPVLREAVALDGQYPVILLSHGWGGNYGRLAWLGTALASKGAIVVSVNHPNSTTRDLDPRLALRHWTRVADMVAALDFVLTSPQFEQRIDPDRIYAAGFSFGGWTALSMAGVRGNHMGLVDYCLSAGRGSQFCADLRAHSVDIAAIDADLFDADYRDPRIKRLVAIDPAFTWSITEEHLSGVDASILLIGLGEGVDRLPVTDTSPSGSNFDRFFPVNQIQVIAPAMHFSALGLCKPEGEAILLEENDDPVCTDPHGTDRALVLEQIITKIVAHFQL